MAAFPRMTISSRVVGLPEEDSTRPATTSKARSPNDGPGAALGDRVRPESARSVPRRDRLAGYFRKPFGRLGLVGDAGYHLHPITAQGITDAS